MLRLAVAIGYLMTCAAQTGLFLEDAGYGCKSAHFGCCPDNFTIAHGPNNEGCGCQYTQFGCCPDRRTESQGPEFEGCTCHTYQFGCCADGVSAATGPSLQGCICQYSKYGCCGDEATAAKGPNKEGCDCSNSKFGCCPDGVTEAKGDKFLNCSDVPENKQAACALPYDKGSCGNFSVYWSYDVSYGGCVRFWYGGCEGNGNRFSSQEECEDVCVRPPPKDSCNLPKVKGICEGYNIRWYYDASREQCSQFVYGGCLGNNNNFDSQALCQERCEPDKTEDQCNLPIEQGSCAGNFLRWGYDSKRRRCEQFIWGGCEGNSNRFISEAACKLRCSPPGVPIPQERCTLPAVTGECAKYTQRWYYDTKHMRCRQFYYGGCGGNENNFMSEFECENRCMEQPIITTLAPLTQTPVTPAPQPQTDPNRSEICFEQKDSGPCAQLEERWAYDSARGVCTRFQYGGCDGSRNNFPSLEYCQYYCAPAQDICQLPMLSGPCDASLMRWFYDATTDSCSQFTYSGCEGNENRFDSIEECERQCRTGAPATTTTTSTTTTTTTTTIAPEYIPPECQVSPTLEECRDAGKVWYLDLRQRACVAYINANSGFLCRNTGVYSSQEACERSCGAFRDSDPCNQPAEQGDCTAYIYMWHYDSSRDECGEFLYGGCKGNDNRFQTQQECENRCKNKSTTVGIGFASSSTTPTTTSIRIPNPSTTISPFDPNELNSRFNEPECTTPSSVEPCGANVTVYYYDTRTQACLVGDFGGCRYRNSYRTEEECERRCGTFQGIDVCRVYLDPGPCLSAITKYYWHAVSGQCLPFANGGCHGGPNRFSTAEECEEVCGTTGSEPSENEVSCDSYAAECAALRCEYAVQRTRTPGGCEHCECVPVEVDCAPLRRECDTLKCNYGVERTTDDDSCESCRCIEHPCLKTRCAAGERCVTTSYRDALTLDVRYSAECRIDPVNGPAGISGTPNAVVVGEMGRSLSIRCLAYGYPQPAIYWYRGQNGSMLPYNSSLYEARGNVLQIRKLMPETLGEYICQAYNGYGKPADWAFLVQASRPEGSEYPVTRQTERSVTPYEYEPQTEPTTARTTEVEIPYSVPVRTRITTDRTRLSAGSEINLPCDVDGFPVPEVYWTKDGAQIQRQPADDRIYVTEARLTITRANTNDSGVYGCHANNGYTSDYSTVQIIVEEARLTITRANTNDSGVYGCHANNGYTSDYSTVQIIVEGLYIPANCKDMQFFVHCNLIVKSKFCHHRYYSRFCCKSCVEAGQLDPNEVELMQADMARRRK